MTDAERLLVAAELLRAVCRLSEGAQAAVWRAAALLPDEGAEGLHRAFADLGTALAAITSFLERRGFPAPPPTFDTGRPTPGGVN